MQISNSPVARRRIIWSAAVLIVVIVLGLGVFDIVALPGCESCHDRDGFRAATAASAHAKADCRSCHVPAGLVDRVAFTLRQPLHMFVPVTGGAVRDAAAVPDSRCVPCHTALKTGASASNGLRIAHASCAVGAACTDCHSATAHGAATLWLRAYDMDRCLVCHVTSAQTDCDLCHEGRSSAERVRSGTFAVTHGAQWRKTHGMGNPATCVVCHQRDACVGCHGPGLPHDARFVAVHAGYATSKDAKCSGCHERAFCDDCHGTPMPHPATFTSVHAKAAAAKPASCRRCHDESDCTTCHVKHIHPGGAVGGSLPKVGTR